LVFSTQISPFEANESMLEHLGETTLPPKMLKKKWRHEVSTNIFFTKKSLVSIKEMSIFYID
jgi:hypothetical protein